MRTGLITALVILSTTLFAQDQSHFGVKGGLALGMNIGITINSANNSTLPSPGGVAGVFYRLQKKHFVFMPEILYVQKGGMYKEWFTVIDTTTGVAIGQVITKLKGKLHYIDVPIMLGAEVKGFQIYAGPVASFNIKGTLGVRPTAEVNAPNTDVSSFNQDYTDLSRFDFGIQMGFGYKLELDKYIMLFEARYGISLTQYQYGDLPFKDRNKYLLMTIGWGF